MGVITEIERQKYFAYLDGVADGLNESRNDVSEVLDKIRAEIEQITDTMGVSYNQYVSKIDVLQILDKYKAESEVEDGNIG